MREESRISLERNGLGQTVCCLAAARQLRSMRWCSRRLFDSRLRAHCVVCCLAGRLPPHPLPLAQPVLTHPSGKGGVPLALKGVKDSPGGGFPQLQREEKPGTLLSAGCNVAREVVTTIWAVSICAHISLLISPYLPAPISNDRCWKRCFASAAAVQVSSPRSDRDSHAEGQQPAELDPRQLAQTHQPSLGVERKKRSTRELAGGVSEMGRGMGGAVFAHGPAGMSPWEMLH